MASYDFERGELDFLDVVALISLDIAFQNLSLNKQQIDELMSELRDKQDTSLEIIIQQNKEIIKQNEIIISMLKEKK